jgi:hypothetical protein
MPGSPAIAELISSSGADDPRDVRNLVAQVISELGLEPLSEDEASRILIAEIAIRITSGVVEPEVGAREVWRLASSLPIDERPNELIGLSSEWEEIRSEQRSKLRAEIIGAARDLLIDWRAKFPRLPL